MRDFEKSLVAANDRRADGLNIAGTMTRIFQNTGTPAGDPGTKRSFRRLDLMAALEHVTKKQPQATIPHSRTA